MLDLLTLAQQDTGAEFRRATVGNDGPEYTGPCPICREGVDRFHVWPNHSDGKPRWWCRQCGNSGDLADYLEEARGMEHHEALRQAGINGNGGNGTEPKAGPPQVVAKYNYTDENGAPLFQVRRWEPGQHGEDKSFTQHASDGNGGWLDHLGDARRVLYHLPEVLAARPGQYVYLCEGEKSADATRSLGVPATTKAGGALTKAEQWIDGYTEALAGHPVVILTDNDEPGHTHGQIAAAKLYSYAESVRILNLPGLKEKGDPWDWVHAGGTLGQLADLATSTPEYIRRKQGWEVYTLEDAYAPRAKKEYAIENVLRLPGLSVVYSQPGNLKTMLMVDAGMDVSAGLPWLPPLPGKLGVKAMQTTPVPVLWVDFDNGIEEMLSRIAAAAKARNLPDSTPFYCLSMPDPWLDMVDFQSANLLIKRATTLGARLIIVDNLGNVSGKADENSAEMAHVMRNFRRVSEEANAHVVIIHHQRKSSGFKGSAGETLRGHSSINAAIDLALLIERAEQADEIKVSATKTRGADVWPFGALFTYEHKPKTTDLASFRFYGIEVEGTKSPAAIRRTVLETVKENRGKLNKGQLTETVKEITEAGTHKVRNEIENLVSLGKLVVLAGKRDNAKIYDIPTDDPQDTLL